MVQIDAAASCGCCTRCVAIALWSNNYSNSSSNLPLNSRSNRTRRGAALGGELLQLRSVEPPSVAAASTRCHSKGQVAAAAAAASTTEQPEKGYCSSSGGAATLCSCLLHMMLCIGHQQKKQQQHIESSSKTAAVSSATAVAGWDEAFGHQCCCGCW